MPSLLDESAPHFPSHFNTMASSSQDANNDVADAVQVSAEEESSSGPSLEIDVWPTSPWWGTN